MSVSLVFSGNARLVEGEDGNGGHGFLAKLKRFPDETEK